MKKILFIFALTIFSFANAQKGSYLVSGNVYFNSNKNSNSNSSNNQYIGFNPKIGYQFTNNWTIGLESSFNQNKWTRETNNYENKRNNLSIGSFIRYSKQFNDTFTFFTDLGVGFQNYKEYYKEDNQSDTTTKANGFYTNLQPMIHLKIKNNFGINFGLGGISYNSLKNDKFDNTESNFNVSFGQAYTIGFQKTF